MIRKLCGLILAVAFALAVSGACAQDEHHISSKKEEQHESTPTDASPGEMVVE